MLSDAVLFKQLFLVPLSANFQLKLYTVFRYCGDTIPPRYQTRGNQVYIKFKSDFSVGHSGFRASYETGRNDKRFYSMPH